MIYGVEIKELKTFPDDRGFFREVIRNTDPFFTNNKFGQWSHSKMTKDVVKAWHYHHIQTDWWYVPIGLVNTVLFDGREESPTYKTKMEIKMGDDYPVCVKIPTGVLHGCKVLSEVAHLFYITSETYNTEDEGRYPYNSDFVPHDWGNCITVENDRRRYEPKNNRVKINN